MTKKNQKGKLKKKVLFDLQSLNKRFDKKKLQAIRNSPFFLKKDEEVRKELGTKEFKDLLKKYPTKKNTKSLTNKGKSAKKTSSKSNPRKLKRFTKAQLEAIRNAPMFVRKNKAADEFFSSPGYLAIARENTAIEKIKVGKKKTR